MSEVDFSALDDAGLNLRAVFDRDQLPDTLHAALAPYPPYRQLILIGHGGRRLWAAVCAAGIDSADPIDAHTAATLRGWFAAELSNVRWQLVYPGETVLGLQTLGRLAGWHHDSPFRVGINADWGTWFAYRAVVLADTRLPLVRSATSVSPCQTCAQTPCVTACPADALRDGVFSPPDCMAYRVRPGSRCAMTCVARTDCPVRPEHRYASAQIAHSYARSLAAIQAHARIVAGTSGEGG